jgi:hypothetical protein
MHGMQGGFQQGGQGPFVVPGGVGGVTGLVVGGGVHVVGGWVVGGGVGGGVHDGVVVVSGVTLKNKDLWNSSLTMLAKKTLEIKISAHFSQLPGLLSQLDVDAGPLSS